MVENECNQHGKKLTSATIHQQLVLWQLARLCIRLC